MRWLQALYVANGLAYGVFISFLSVFLRYRGFDDALVGVASSLGALAYTVALPVWGHVGDVLLGPRRAVRVAVIPAIFVSAAFDLPLPAVLLIGLDIVLAMLGGPIGALTDAMAVPFLPDPARDYARLRLLTSAGAAAGAVGTGAACAVVGGYWLAPLVYAVVSGLLVVTVQFVPVGRLSDRNRNAERGGTASARSAAGVAAGLLDTEPAPELLTHGRFGSVSEAVRGRPRFVATLGSIFLIYVGVMAGTTFLSLRISDLGGGPLDVGVSTGFGSIAEVPGLMLGGLVAARFGLRRLLIGSGLLFAACVGAWAILADPASIVVSRLFAGVAFGAMTVGFVLTIARLLPARLQSTGQTLYAATAFGAAAVIANLVGGAVKQLAGPVPLFGGAAILALLGVLVGALAAPRGFVGRERTGPGARAHLTGAARRVGSPRRRTRCRLGTIRRSASAAADSGEPRRTGDAIVGRPVHGFDGCAGGRLHPIDRA